MDEQKLEEEILKRVDEKLDDIADFLFTKSQENIVEMGLIDESTLLQSGDVIRNFLDKRIVYTAPHAAPLEYGTEPHMPPVDPIKAWCERKLGLKGKEAEKAAWAIAVTISKEGTQPHSYMRKAVQATIQKFRGSVL